MCYNLVDVNRFILTKEFCVLPWTKIPEVKQVRMLKPFYLF